MPISGLRSNGVHRTRTNVQLEHPIEHNTRSIEREHRTPNTQHHRLQGQMINSLTKCEHEREHKHRTHVEQTSNICSLPVEQAQMSNTTSNIEQCFPNIEHCSTTVLLKTRQRSWLSVWACIRTYTGVSYR